MSKKTKTIIGIIIAVLVVGLLAFLLTDVIAGAKEVEASEFFKKLGDGTITELYVDGYNWTGYGVDLTTGKEVSYTTTSLSVYDFTSFQAFEEYMVEKYNPAFSLSQLKSFEIADPNAGSFWSSIWPTLAIVVVAFIFFLLIKNAAGGGNPNMNMGKNKAQVQTHLKVRFSDVAGAEEEKEELAEGVEFLKSPRKFSALGARIPSGVLLVGPPGTGKTLFAKAVAGEAGVPFFSVSGSDFVEMYVGVGAKRVRDLFDMAKKNQPCIIFVDEIDAVGRRRGAGLGGGHDE